MAVRAVGDRHLAEFCPAEWYIGTKENGASWDYKLTGDQIKSLVDQIVGEQETTVKAALNRDLELAFSAFVNDPLVTVDSVTARELFDEMVENTKSYLTEYFN